jgi:hypothetical protein
MKVLLIVAAAGCALAQPPDVSQIMSRVAINQARSQDMRKSYVYNQKQLLRMVRGGGRIAREEHREYTITPQDRGVHKELTRFDGKYEQHGKYIAYDHPGYQYKNVDIDGEIIDDMSKDMTDDRNSRDGISCDLFPLTYHQQLKYNFRLLKTQQYRGREVYRVAFEPKPRPKHAEGDEGGDTIWKGEALIDAEEYQPVYIASTMALKIPAAVKILLGTDIRGLGFAVSYQKFADGVWFPVSYGGEFQVKAVFFYKRHISISMVNSDFQRVDVTSSIAYKTGDK